MAPNKWNQRYVDATLPTKPCSLLLEQEAHVPTFGVALDLACGLGGNAIWLAERGLSCLAWDNATTAIDLLSNYAATHDLAVRATLRDVEKMPPEPNSLDVIVVSFFLHRPILPALVSALRTGGILFYQTFVRHPQASGGPTNPSFILDKDELPSQFAALELRYYQEVLQDNGSALAKYVGVKR